MKLLISTTFGIIFCFVTVNQVSAGIFGPSNYDECVLNSMKGVTSDMAARLIAKSCREKYPENKIKRNIRELSDGEVKNLTGRGGPSGNYFSVDLLNSNSKVTVSQVTVAVITKIGGKETPNFYDQDITIGPYKTSNIFVRFIPGDVGAKYSWSIVSAKGY